MKLYKGVNDALYSMLLECSKQEPISSRNGDCWQIAHNVFTVENPLSRYNLLPWRKDNPLAKIVETLWVLSGDVDTTKILPYLPRAAAFADDGVNWRGGYGRRLRRPAVDCIEEVYRLLKEDPMTRRAVINIFDGDLDYVDSKDIPCNNWLSFELHSNGKLNMDIAVRSNDLVWGFSGINFFEWSVLQQMLAEWLDVEVGTQTWLQTSAHVYFRHVHLSDVATPVGDKPEKLRLGITRELYQAKFAPVWDALHRWEQGELDFGIPVEAAPGTCLYRYLEALQAYWRVRYEEPLDYDWDFSNPFDISFSLYLNRVFPGVTPHSFLMNLVAVQNEKARYYGNSWCRYGDLFSIIPNVLRKVDRLGNILSKDISTSTSDETLDDTVGDLMVYLAKWLARREGHVIEEQNIRASNLTLTKLVPADSPGTLLEVVQDTSDMCEHVMQQSDSLPDPNTLRDLLSRLWGAYLRRLSNANEITSTPGGV